MKTGEKYNNKNTMIRECKKKKKKHIWAWHRSIAILQYILLLKYLSREMYSKKKKKMYVEPRGKCIEFNQNMAKRNTYIRAHVMCVRVLLLQSMKNTHSRTIHKRTHTHTAIQTRILYSYNNNNNTFCKKNI